MQLLPYTAFSQVVYVQPVIQLAITFRGSPEVSVTEFVIGQFVDYKAKFCFIIKQWNYIHIVADLFFPTFNR